MYIYIIYTEIRRSLHTQRIAYTVIVHGSVAFCLRVCFSVLPGSREQTKKITMLYITRITNIHYTSCWARHDNNNWTDAWAWRLFLTRTHRSVSVLFSSIFPQPIDTIVSPETAWYLNRSSARQMTRRAPRERNVTVPRHVVMWSGRRTVFQYTSVRGTTSPYCALAPWALGPSARRIPWPRAFAS